MVSCCKHNTKDKTCKRIDGKIFKLPRRFTRKKCKHPRGFTMRSSCAPYKNCFKETKKDIVPTKAVAVLYPNNNNVTGTVIFTQDKKHLHIEYDIKGMKDGKHGFHIHEYGDYTDGCNSSCSHFNPDNTTHGGVTGENRHAGDLGNIVSKNKRSKGTICCSLLSLNPKSRYNIIGRMILVHEDEDDLGNGDNEESLKTGNAGSRLACGVIGIAKPI